MGILKEKARERGYELLRDDEIYLRRLTEKMPSAARKAALIGYFDEWDRGMREAADYVHSQNAGRRRANIYIRELTKDKSAKTCPV